MKILQFFPRFLPCLCAIPLLAQPQVGGGTCTSSSLNGTYSLTLSGRALNTQSNPELFFDILQGVGTATFDGLSKVTFALTQNGTAGLGVAATMSGTYSIQSNCVGALNITTPAAATYVLGVFNSGSNYFITGEDGIHNLTGSGTTLPTTACSNATFNGDYSFNGNGFGLESGAVPASNDINAANNVAGIFEFDGEGDVAVNWVTEGGGIRFTSPNSASGSYTVTAACSGIATVIDTAGSKYELVFTITSANGSFIVNAANTPNTGTGLIFIASGRPL